MIKKKKEISYTEAVIYDVDGTLCNVTSIRHLVECDKPDFDAFHTASAECPTNEWVVADLQNSVQSHQVIIVMTGRQEKFRGLTVEWLRTHNIPFDLLMMRPNGDFRKDFMVKRDMLNEVRLRGFVITRAWDDNPQIIDLWENEGIPVTVVPGWTGKR